MNDNSIKITAGGDVTISGAVGNQAKSANFISLGAAEMQTITDSFSIIRDEIDEVSKSALITQPQAEKLNGELETLETLTTDEKLTEEGFQTKAVQFCERMNFVCDSAASVANVAKYLMLIGTTLGFKISVLM